MDFNEKQRAISSYFSRINILYRRLAKKYKMSYNTMVLLYILNERAPCTQKQIVDEWELPKQTVNTIIKSLEKEDYVSFEFDINNKEKSIYLTEKGEFFIEEAIEDIIALEHKIYEQMGEKTCDGALKGLKEFHQILETEVNKK